MDGLLTIMLFGGAMFLMMKFGCGSHMSGHGHGKNKETKSGALGGGCCGGKKKSVSPNINETKGGPPAKDTDPVCGIIVSTNNAKTSFHDGLVYFFCSNECRNVFEASPEKYAVNEIGATSTRLEHQSSKGDGHA